MTNISLSDISWIDQTKMFVPSSYFDEEILGIDSGDTTWSEILHIENWIVCCIETYLITHLTYEQV